MEPVITLPALGDNYIYLYQCDNNNTLVVDPGDGSAVLVVLEDQGLALTTVLTTHHHVDHVSGVNELKKKPNAR